MRILTRYVLREFSVPLGYTLAGFVSLYVLFELFGSFSRMMSAKPDFLTVVSYFAGYLAPYFEWMAPACLMLATLYTMWRFCRHSELIAMRASGIGFLAIVKPLLLVAVAMAAFVAWVNEVYVPRRAQWAKQYRAARFDEEKMERADDIVYHNAAANRTWKIGLAPTEDAHVLEDVKVSVDWPQGGRKMTINAPRAEYLDGQWHFSDPVVFYFDQKGGEMASPTPALEKLTLRTFPEFDEQPEDFIMQNRDWAYCSVSDRIRYLRAHPGLPEEMRRSYTYDLAAQITAPLACIIITLFAIPAGVATGRQSVFKGIVGALGMFFAFYGLTIGFMILAKRGLCPPVLAAILPDAVFFAIGCRLFWNQR